MSSKNLQCTRGDDKFFVLTFTDSNGDPIDITGWTVYFTVKSNLNDSDDDALISKDVTDHTSPTNGITKIHLTSSDTNLVGTYFYDIQIKRDDDVVLTVLEGNITFKRDVTQRT